MALSLLDILGSVAKAENIRKKEAGAAELAEEKLSQQELKQKQSLLASILGNFDIVKPETSFTQAQAQTIPGVREGAKPGFQPIQTGVGQRFVPPGSALPPPAMQTVPEGAFDIASLLQQAGVSDLFPKDTLVKRKKSTPLFGDMGVTPEEISKIPISRVVSGRGGTSVTREIPKPEKPKEKKVIDYQAAATKNVKGKYDNKTWSIKVYNKEADKEIQKEKQRLIQLYGGFYVKEKATGFTGWIPANKFNKKKYEKVGQ